MSEFFVVYSITSENPVLGLYNSIELALSHLNQMTKLKIHACILLRRLNVPLSDSENDMKVLYDNEVYC